MSLEVSCVTHCSLVKSFLYGSRLGSSLGCLAATGGVQSTLLSPAAVAEQCRERGELGRYPAETRTCHQQYGTWLAASAVSVAHPGNSDHWPLRLAQRKREENTQALTRPLRLAERRVTTQQSLSDNAALPCVMGCVEMVVLPTIRWSDREHLFIHKEDKVSDRLRELLKQKLSALQASSAVRVCQLLCTAPLETFQTQILTNNPGHRRPMNTRLSWYLRTVLWICGLSSWLRTKSLTVSTFSSVRALRGLPLPVNCACVPQLFQHQYRFWEKLDKA